MHVLDYYLFCTGRERGLVSDSPTMRQESLTSLTDPQLPSSLVYHSVGLE